MLENIKKLIQGEEEMDFVTEAMIQGTDTDIADTFIELDGEAEIPESEINKILNNIPSYDEEAELNKKLSKLEECFIPEDLQ